MLYCLTRQASMMLTSRLCNRYENTEMRAKKLEDIGIMYMGMGVSGGEEGARNGEWTLDAGLGELVAKEHT